MLGTARNTGVEVCARADDDVSKEGAVSLGINNCFERKMR